MVGVETDGMSDKEVQRLTLENCQILYTHKDGKVTVFHYSGSSDEVIRELMEKYLLPKERYLEHPYHPHSPWWGDNPL